MPLGSAARVRAARPHFLTGFPKAAASASYSGGGTSRGLPGTRRRRERVKTTPLSARARRASLFP